MNTNYSVLMSVYYKEKPEFLDEAIQSMMSQTIVTNDFVLICDGKLTDELDSVIDKYKKKYSDIFNVIQLDENMGLGKALNIALPQCKNELIARMDSDDYSLPDRCEKQLEYFDKNQDVDVVGCQIEEFVGDKSNIVSRRCVAVNSDDIIGFAKSRCPMNHMSVMYKKTAVIESGNYLDMKFNEDYYLWIRMLLNNCKFANLADTLVLARIDRDTFGRRGGYKYFKAQKEIFKFMRKKKFISYFKYIKNVIVRFISAVLIPTKLRQKLFLKYMRKGVNR